jgi:hypothetical protein
MGPHIRCSVTDFPSLEKPGQDGQIGRVLLGQEVDHRLAYRWCRHGRPDWAGRRPGLAALVRVSGRRELSVRGPVPARVPGRVWFPAVSITPSCFCGAWVKFPGVSPVTWLAPVAAATGA